MPAIFEYRLTVADDDIDLQGHVNNLVYLKWAQSAAVAHSTTQGWSTDRYLETDSAWVVRSHQIEYLQPAFAGDEIVVQTWVANMKKITSLRKYHIRRTGDDALLATAETNWAYLGMKHRVPRRIPPELSEAFELVDEANEPTG